MILSEREIQALLDDGAVRIDPRPPVAPPDPRDNLWTSTAVDLTLDGVILEWTPPQGAEAPRGGAALIQPHSRNFDVQGMMEDPRLARKVSIDADKG